MIRFHLDESVSNRIAHRLQDRGLDATTTSDAGLIGVSDKRQLEFAASNGRVLITQDQDFLRLAAVNYEHFGVVYAAKRWVSVEEIVRFCAELAVSYTTDQLKGRIEYVPAGKPPG